MKRLWLIPLLVIAGIGLSGSASAQNGQKPTHGCDQALENDGDIYDSTCDGSPSLNGNGNGNANGKPCAGCVGAADNKNPKGQLPGPEDHNKGYECDGNNGIGKGNPAHSACEPYSNGSPTSKLQKVENVAARFPVADDPSPKIPLGVVLMAGLVVTVMLGLGSALRNLRR